MALTPRRILELMAADGLCGIHEANHVSDLLEAIDADGTLASTYLLDRFQRNIVASGAMSNRQAAAFCAALSTRAGGSAASDSVALQTAKRRLAVKGAGRYHEVEDIIDNLLLKAVAASCSVTLTGAIGPANGYAAADISGQTFSVTGASANVYLASSPFITAGERRAMPAAGKKCWVQMDSFATSGGFGTNTRAGFLAFDGAGNAIAHGQARGVTSGGVPVIGSIGFETAAGVPIGTVTVPAGPQYISLGIDSAGEIYYYNPAAQLVVSCGSENPAVAGALAGAATIVLFGMCDLSGGGPASASGTFTTDQANMLDSGAAALAGDEDWCGGTIS